MTQDRSSALVAGGSINGGDTAGEPALADSGILVHTTPARPWTTVISLVGVHDLSTAPELERSAGKHLARCDRLVVDLARASFVDSSIVNALVRLARQARPRGLTFHVVAARGSHPHRVLALMGLLDHLGCIDTLPEYHGEAPPPGEAPKRRS